jgi:hypothetical protein
VPGLPARRASYVRFYNRDVLGETLTMFPLGKLRPQIFLAIALLGCITIYAIYADMVEVATGTIGGLVALGMKVLESD